MKLPPRFKNTLLTLAFIALIGGLAALTQRFTGQIDITSNASNTLSEASQKVLANLPDKVQITAYLKKDAAIRRQIEQLVARYSDYKADVSLTFVDPASIPEKTRELNIGSEGGIIIDYHFLKIAYFLINQALTLVVKSLQVPGLHLQASKLHFPA